MKYPTIWGSYRFIVACAACVATPLLADPILAPGDPIIPFDLDFTDVSASSYPTNEGPSWALDGARETKYRNQGGVNSGFIVEPSMPGVVKSFIITTANNRPQEDPAAWRLYGTNDPVITADNGTGRAENWVLIDEGTLSLPDARFTSGSPVNVNITQEYAAYKMIFTAAKDSPEPAEAIHFSEIQFYSEANGGGMALLSPGDRILAVQDPVEAAPSSYPGNETPAHAIDGDPNTKYLNFGKQGAGFIVTPSRGSTVLRSFQLVTANDAVPRDPTSYEIYGTNDDIISEDNSDGEAESWVLIQAGTLNLPDTRFAEGELIQVEGDTAYKSYRIIFPTVKNANSANSMQIAEVRLFSDPDGTDPILDPSDFIIAVVVPSSNSSYTNDSIYNEGPLRAIDGRDDTKYLNRAYDHSGFIVTPTSGPAVVKSMVLTTANDAPGRDPAAWELYGTNDPIFSEDNSNGEGENWTLVDQGYIDLPEDRWTVAAPIRINNATAYASWKLVFPLIKEPGLGLMQIAEVQFYTGENGDGTPVLAPLDPIIAIQAPHSESNSPNVEQAPNAIDGDVNTKYLNFGGINSGFIVTPSYGPSIVTGFTITTANDFPERDPQNWELYGTNSPIASPPHSTGDFEDWTLIASGDIYLPDDRFAPGEPVEFNNTTSYTSFRFVVTGLKGGATMVQFAEIQFEGTAGTVAPPPDSSFRITSISRSDGNVTLTWNSEANASYRISYSTNLSNWQGTAVETVNSGGATTTHTFAIPAAVATAPAVYFRVEKK